MKNHGDESSFLAKRYGRMFPYLKPAIFKKSALEALAATMFTESKPKDSDIPAGYTYFGQFIDHDITRDARGGDIPKPIPEPINNTQLATPSLDLDSLYGNHNQYLNQHGQFTLKGTDPSNTPSQPDLERQLFGRARIADARNEDNLAVMHFHILFQQLHNEIFKTHKSGQRAYGPPVIPQIALWAKERTVLHYQHLVLNDFLRRILHPETYQRVIIEDRCHFFKHEPCESPPMPVEFSGGAYRFGHSMVRDHYHWNQHNKKATALDLLQKTGLGGELGDENRQSNAWYINWSNFLPLDAKEVLNNAKSISTQLASALGSLPHSGGGSLAYRNLARGVSYGLPSGQNVQRELSTKIFFHDFLTPEKIFDAGTPEQQKVYSTTNLHIQTPLWFYCLLEAEILCDGQHLGPVGSQIVAEVLLNLIRCSTTSVRGSGFDPAQGELKDVVGRQPFELKHIVQFVSN